MKYNPEMHRRRSIRLKEYDYSQEGVYFITICARNRMCLFGEVLHDQMILNAAGHMIAFQWEKLSNRFNHIQLDEYIIMPNHFHGIIIVGAPLVGALDANVINTNLCNKPNKNIEHTDLNNIFNNVENVNLRNPARAPTKGAPTIGDMIGTFKSITTGEYIKGVTNNNWASFDKKIWQQNYYEHIIRNEKSLEIIREYIVNNPHTWEQDELFS